MNEVRLFNTLTGKKEPVKPINPGAVGIYVCGITPYDDPHLGHARCYVVFDLLKRILKKNGYFVKHIQNFTDIDDKIIERASHEKADPLQFAEKYIRSFNDAMTALNVIPADDYPRVTQQIPVIIALIERLVKRGFAYLKEGSVYYSVRTFKPYGQLSRRKIDDLIQGVRVEVDDKKEDPLDFALWKKAKDGEPFWESPWGRGRPGWHIECSAMSMNSLGEEFDIHGGGQDLIFPHHENEVAQSRGATGRLFAHLWVHNGFVTINKEKMSKSLGNFFTIKEILAQFDPMVVRYFLLTQHYRSPLHFSDADLKTVERTWRGRVVGAHRIASENRGKSTGTDSLGEDVWKKLEGYSEDFNSALTHDMNTASALGLLNQFCGSLFEIDKAEGVALSAPNWERLLAMLDDMLDELGLRVPRKERWSAEILRLVKDREKARREKNWRESDRLREELKAKGVLVKDSSSGPRLCKV